MKPKNRRLLLLCTLAATAAFSAASLKANYYSVSHHSTFSCQPIIDQDSFSGALVYNESGIRNASEANPMVVSCPVNMDSLVLGDIATYEIHMIAGGTEDVTAGQIGCILSEVRNIDGAKLQALGRVANLIGTSKKTLLWGNVQRQANAAESAFSIQCSLPPQSGLINITINRNSLLGHGGIILGS